MSETTRFARLALALGVAVAVLFPVLGLAFDFSRYGDGSIFAYAVAVADSWAFHFENISGRATVHLLTYRPAEALVTATGDPALGVAAQAALFFGLPLAGLLLTRLVETTPGRPVSVLAAIVTAAVLPLVYISPTELWATHALFFPALALAVEPRGGWLRGLGLAVLVGLLALTHEAGLILVVGLVPLVALARAGSTALVRAGFVVLVAVAAWFVVTRAFRPDAYIAEVLGRNALTLVDPARLAAPALLLALGAGAATLLLAAVLGRARAGIAGLVVALAVLGLWVAVGGGVHTDQRYYVRAVVPMALAGAGLVASLLVARSAGLTGGLERLLPRALPPGAGAALLAVVFVHAGETAKFTAGWRDYLAGIGALATGEAADPTLGHPAFVASTRLPERLDRFSWNSTTPYLSVLQAPGFAPKRLVVDPRTGYFWLPCAKAEASRDRPSAVPAEPRAWIAAYSCLHRP